MSWKVLTLKKGIKQYGYTYENKGKLIERSVFSGVTRNSLSYQQILNLKSGNIITGFSKLSFHKSFNDLNIKIKSVNKTVKQNNDKLLINNNYVPININLSKSNSKFKLVSNFLRKFISIYNRIIKTY